MPCRGKSSAWLLMYDRTHLVGTLYPLVKKLLKGPLSRNGMWQCTSSQLIHKLGSHGQMRRGKWYVFFPLDCRTLSSEERFQHVL